MHKILKIVQEISFPPRFTAIKFLIMNCSSVLQAMEVIASAGSNHFVQLPQLSIPFRMIGIQQQGPGRVEGFFKIWTNIRNPPMRNYVFPLMKLSQKVSNGQKMISVSQSLPLQSLMHCVHPKDLMIFKIYHGFLSFLFTTLTNYYADTHSFLT